MGLYFSAIFRRSVHSTVVTYAAVFLFAVVTLITFASLVRTGNQHIREPAAFPPALAHSVVPEPVLHSHDGFWCAGKHQSHRMVLLSRDPRVPARVLFGTDDAGD
jgi:hypothetical protein